MTYNLWPKGSQWRKWDLHVHTPASFHWKGGKVLGDMTVEEKEVVFRQLLTAIENADVAVFCFTDYWTFNGYIEFMHYLKRSKLPLSKAVFPGMELRVEAPVDYRLNVQVVLSNSLSDQELIDFKSKLCIGGTNRPISDEAIRAFAKTLDASKAKVHGFEDPEHLCDNDLLLLGAMTIEVTRHSLGQALQSIPAGKGYIILPYDTSDGLLKLDWKTHPHADNYFMQTAHGFESRNQEVVELFLGIETNKNRGFIENFRKTLDHKQKPVICGSDAHRFADYGRYPGSQITWVKADPTFEGFKQIFAEPRERVRIQSSGPEDKTPYLVIDKVRFIDNTGTKIFPTDWIELNENLNTIIGGKSSGKSLLLYHIVKTVAPDLLEKRSQEITIPTYSFGDPEQLDFEVRWKDGRIDRLSDPPDQKNREIEFIPQMYVNALAEKEGRESLYQLIESILEQDSGYKRFMEQMRDSISQIETTIEQDRATLLKLRDDLRLLKAEKKDIGDPAAIEKEIERLSLKIDKLREESGFTPEERQSYERLLRHERIQRERQHRYESLYEAITNQITTVSKLQAQVSGALRTLPVDPRLDGFGKRLLDGLSVSAAIAVTGSFSIIAKSQRTLADKTRVKAVQCERNAHRINELLKPYREKVRDQQELDTLSKQLKQQQEAQRSLLAKQKQIESTIGAGIEARENLFKSYGQLIGCFKSVVMKLQQDEYAKIDEEIVLEASLNFDTKRFWTCFCDLFDLRWSLGSVFGPSFDEHSEFHFSDANHIETITSIFETLSKQPNPNLKFKGNATANDAISQLFKNYFEIGYNIRYKADDILNMSPGKRGLVLLQLILHISNAIHPILIDQPEDNLDNRTIANELRNFLKTKKLMRQIIMVTHDANLVVLTDAENVIVSNQAGQQVEQENAEFRFEYVSGALEHSNRKKDGTSSGILFSQGIREHVCDVLEGGEEAFRKRAQKYGFSNL